MKVDKKTCEKRYLTIAMTNCHVIGPKLSKNTFCEHRLIFYSFTASIGSDETTAGRVVSPCSIMMHHGFRSKDARRARKQNADSAK